MSVFTYTMFNNSHPKPFISGVFLDFSDSILLQMHMAQLNLTQVWFTWVWKSNLVTTAPMER